MFNKLFSKILDSSIWLEPTSTRIVWITLLAAMDEDGYAHFSAIQNLADRAKVTLEEAQKAVDTFIAEDPSSGNTDNGGRRVERVPGGFFILNAKNHRQMISREMQKEGTRNRVARYREAKRVAAAERIARQLVVKDSMIDDLAKGISKEFHPDGVAGK